MLLVYHQVILLGHVRHSCCREVHSDNPVAHARIAFAACLEIDVAVVGQSSRRIGSLLDKQRDAHFGLGKVIGEVAVLVLC